ncbi:uncharacterized protein TNCV_2506021 [Trichonephila clavipes]|uniref:Uncharacterized protein n=1 Tax=Trichonephila clavipes TaxID=2585209 RepID=A0A8X6WG62_TRICX|nr:uncharacterized protein TNCV_2506021 [Trichonephila clavipes]
MEFPTIQHPSSMLISGPSNSGKTYFVKKLLDYEMFKPTPSKIIWCYGAYQTLFDEISNVEFIDGLPSDLSQISNALIIIDDLMSELGGDKKLSNLFTKDKEMHKILRKPNLSDQEKATLYTQILQKYTNFPLPTQNITEPIHEVKSEDFNTNEKKNLTE